MKEKMIEGEIVKTSPVIEQALTSFSPQDAAIAELREKYMPLRVDDVKDAKAVAIVHAARMEIKGYRVKIEKTRKDLKADALEYGRRVDGEAKRLTGQLEEIEIHLESEEGKVEAERNHVKAQAELAKKKRLDYRIAALESAGVVMSILDVETMTDEEFSVRFDSAKAAAWERARREQEAKATREAEEKRLVEERAKLETAKKAERDRIVAEEARIAAERKKLEDERRAIEDEKRRREQEKALEIERAEAVEKAKREVQEKAEREQRDREAAAIREKEKADRIERLKPDIEKLYFFAQFLNDLKIPEFSNAEIDKEVRRITGVAADSVFSIAKQFENK